MHDPVEKYTPGRTHDGTIHVWLHPSVVSNSFGGKLFVDGSLMCKYGSQDGQAGWAVTQIHETSHELVCSAHGAMPISPSAATYLAGRAVSTVAGHHLVRTWSHVRI